ncbi:hypothetical protein N8719_02760 [Flavobacteriaceae bacterium]|nr:hypothetical protein [Flavobacteriaceae bacterium]MDB4591276.1 hypothetical protein [Flavobacteriaceae bacterium]MDC6467497.1 hypothetical protein [Flavobacteriaceae bacterium]
MKKLTYLFLALLIVACSSDDEGNNGSSSNSMNIEGVEYDISAAVLVGYGETDTGSYDWDVLLLGEGITVNNQVLNGSGALLLLDLNTNNPDGLRAGTYTFSENYEREEFTWVAIEGCQNFQGDDCQSELANGQDGTVVISGSEANTNIDVTVTDSNGDTISANYTGGFSFIFF